MKKLIFLSVLIILLPSLLFAVESRTGGGPLPGAASDSTNGLTYDQNNDGTPEMTLDDGALSVTSATIGSTSYNPAREIASLNLTADTVLTAANINAYKYFTNQGDDGEQDITYPAVSYVIPVTILEEEAQIIEVNPPAGEILYLNNTALDADDCIDSPGTGLGVLQGIRKQDSAGAWHWYWYSAAGLWVDTGATD